MKDIENYQGNGDELPDKGQILIYQGKDGDMKIEARLLEESI